MPESSSSSSSNAPVVLVAGGSVYVGTHTVVVLLQHGYKVVVVDNLVNSSAKALDAVCEIVNLKGKERQERLIFHQVDICNEVEMRKVFKQSPRFTACIHFAGLKVLYGKVNE